MGEKIGILNYKSLLLLLSLFAFLLRINLLADQPLRGDESFTVQFSARPLEVVFPEIASVEPNPPLYYLFFHWWMAATGQSEFATRFFSLLFGVLCVPLVFRFGNSLRRQDIGLVAAFLMAINPFQVWHSQDIRLYTLWPALTILNLILFLLALDRNQPRYWAFYGLSTLAGLYTHYFHIFILLAQNLFFFILAGQEVPQRQGRFRRNLLPKWLGIQVVLAVLYTPWLLISNRPTSYNPSGETPQLLTVLPRLQGTFAIGETVPREISLLVGLVLLSLFFAAIIAEWRKERRGLLLLLLYTLIPALGVYLLAQWRPFFRERYLNATAPGFYLLWGYGLLAIQERLPKIRRLLAVGGLLAFALAAAYSLNNYWNHPAYAKSRNWPRLASFLEKKALAEDVVIFNYPDPSLDYYYDGQAPLLILPTRFITPEIKQQTIRRLWQLVNKHQRIWLLPLRNPAWDREGLVETWLRLHATVEEERSPAGFRLLLFTPTLVSEAQIRHPLNFRLGENILLVGYNLEGRISPGETITLTIFWKTLASIEQDYHVFSHLTAADGEILAQKDNPPQEGRYPTSLWAPGELVGDEYQLTIPPQAPLGRYILGIGVYLLSTGERLPVFDSQGQLLGDQIVISEIQGQ